MIRRIKELIHRKEENKMLLCKSIYRMACSNIISKILSTRAISRKEVVELMLWVEVRECVVWLMLRELMPVWISKKVNKQDHCLERDRLARTLIIQMIKRLTGQLEVDQVLVEAFWIPVLASWREPMNSQVKQWRPKLSQATHSHPDWASRDLPKVISVPPVSSPRKQLETKAKSTQTSPPWMATLDSTTTNTCRVTCLQSVAAFLSQTQIALIKLTSTTSNKTMSRNKVASRATLKLIPAWVCQMRAMEAPPKWAKDKVNINSLCIPWIVGKAAKFGYLIAITSFKTNNESLFYLILLLTIDIQMHKLL